MARSDASDDHEGAMRVSGSVAAETPAGRVQIPAHRHTLASHTIGLPQLTALLAELSLDGSRDDYARAVLEGNVLDRPTFAGRQRTLRHLRELYALDPENTAFRVLRRLWEEDPTARTQLGGLLAYASDELWRATFPAISSTRVGDLVPSDALAEAAKPAFGSSLNAASLARLGRNAAASWTQTGHVSGRTQKRRAAIEPRPTAVAYALLLGHLGGLRGSYLLDSPWMAWFATSDERLEVAQAEAVRLGYVDLRRAGDVVEIDVGRLTAEGPL